MKIPSLAMITLLAGLGLSGCAVTDPPRSADDSTREGTVLQGVELEQDGDGCASVDACIDTAQRDGNLWLVPQCCAVLGANCPRC